MGDGVLAVDHEGRVLLASETGGRGRRQTGIVLDPEDVYADRKHHHCDDAERN